jgi:hypothetical protein
LESQGLTPSPDISGKAPNRDILGVSVLLAYIGIHRFLVLSFKPGQMEYHAMQKLAMEDGEAEDEAVTVNQRAMIGTLFLRSLLTSQTRFLRDTLQTILLSESYCKTQTMRTQHL